MELKNETKTTLRQIRPFIRRATSSFVPTKGSGDPGIVSKASTTANPAISPSPILPENNPKAAQPIIDKTSTPWERALGELRPEDRVGIDFQKSSKLDLLDEFIQGTKESKRECEAKRWGYCESSGEKVFYAENLLTQLNKYVAIGDIAIQGSPQVVALAWAGFRLLLKAATTDIENMRLVFNSLEYLVRVLSRCDIYEKLYAGKELQASKLLDTSLVNLYVSILQYLCCVRKELGRGVSTRILKSISSDLEGLFEEIRECETDVRNDADMAEKESAKMGGFALEERTKILEDVLFRINEPILNIECFVQSMYECLGNEKRLKILMWLSGVPFRDHHSYFKMRRHNNTGYWLVQNKKFRNWRNSISSSILWLRGDAGAGKTMLASKIIDEFQPEKDTTGHALAYFYCCFREEERRDPASVLRALVKQLCLTAPGGALPKSVLSIHQAREDEGHSSGPLSLDESKELIINLSAGFSQTTIIVDALDECNQSTRKELFSIFKQILASATHTRIFVTSRNDGDIRNMFDGLPSHYINATDNHTDIDVYINSEIGDRFNEGLLPKDEDYKALQTDIISALSKGANGMFMWVHFQILAICEEHTPGNIRKALARLPEDLNETYDRIIQKINNQSPDNVRTAKKVLKWLLYINERSSPEIINEFLSVTPGEGTLDSGKWTQHRILDICQNLVVYDEEVNVLRLAHLSVQEFLLRQTEFSQEEKTRTNILIAEVCLTVLTYHHSETQSSPTPELLRYAVTNWADKVRMSGDGSSVLKELWKNFLKHPSVHYCAADANCRNSYEETPLYYAAQHGFNNFVKLLIEQQDVDINSKNESGRVPLHSAAYFGSGVVRMLLEKCGADLEGVQKALVLVATRGHGEVVRVLLENGRVGLEVVQRALLLDEGGCEEVAQILQEKIMELGDVPATLLLAAERGHEKEVLY